MRAWWECFDGAMAVCVGVVVGVVMMLWWCLWGWVSEAGGKFCRQQQQRRAAAKRSGAWYASLIRKAVMRWWHWGMHVQGAGRHMIVEMNKSVRYCMWYLWSWSKEQAITCYYHIERSSRADVSRLEHWIRATGSSSIRARIMEDIYINVLLLRRQICDQGTISVCNWSVMQSILCGSVCE